MTNHLLTPAECDARMVARKAAHLAAYRAADRARRIAARNAAAGIGPCDFGSCDQAATRLRQDPTLRELKAKLPAAVWQFCDNHAHVWDQH